jgi:hypothetical protein
VCVCVYVCMYVRVCVLSIQESITFYSFIWYIFIERVFPHTDAYLEIYWANHRKANIDTSRSSTSVFEYWDVGRNKWGHL